MSDEELIQVYRDVRKELREGRFKVSKWPDSEFQQMVITLANAGRELRRRGLHSQFYRVVAVLSTTVLPKDGVYRVETLPPGRVPDIRGVPHYIGHPATREIVESLGAVPAPTKLFEGLEPGEAAVCFPIAQGKSARAVEGFASPHQEVTLEDLQVRVVTRLE
jgi:hypothetical protein